MSISKHIVISVGQYLLMAEPMSHCYYWLPHGDDIIAWLADTSHVIHVLYTDWLRCQSCNVQMPGKHQLSLYTNLI